ncbi:MAG: hypothetical protein ACFCU7_02500 [Pleurocapsa sp.]
MVLARSAISHLDNEGNIEVAKTLQSVADNLSGFNAFLIAIAIKKAIALIVSEIKYLEKID